MYSEVTHLVIMGSGHGRAHAGTEECFRAIPNCNSLLSPQSTPFGGNCQKSGQHRRRGMFQVVRCGGKERQQVLTYGVRGPDTKRSTGLCSNSDIWSDLRVCRLKSSVSDGELSHDGGCVGAWSII